MGETVQTLQEGTVQTLPKKSMVNNHPQARVAFERLTHYGPGYTVEVTLAVN